MREQELKFKDVILTNLTYYLKKIDIKKYSILKTSSIYEDTQLSYDMKLNIDMMVSVRIRDNKYKRFQDLTIRSKSKNGGKTEIDKILEGKAQIYFYAYMNKEESDLEEINICDIDILRSLHKENKYTKQNNLDGTKFYAYKFQDIKNYANQNNLLYINSN